MALPDYQGLMRPILEFVSDGQAHSVAALRERIIERLGITADDLRERTSGGQPLFHNRIGWALTYLTQARALMRPKRDTYQLTERGRSLLASGGAVDSSTLLAFPEFQEFLSRSGSATRSAAPRPEVVPVVAQETRETPEESLDQAYQRLRSTIEAELLQHVKTAPPDFFERLVVDLLVRMGYGGTLEDAGQAIGRSGDGGIDGIIKEDRLGLDVIHIQAKRYTEKSVGRPDVQAFAGSLEGVRARKGIFITTSDFTADARDYVSQIDKRIILVDGRQLAAHMYDFGVGVSKAATYEVKEVDPPYFGEE